MPEKPTVTAPWLGRVRIPIILNAATHAVDSAIVDQVIAVALVVIGSIGSDAADVAGESGAAVNSQGVVVIGVEKDVARRSGTVENDAVAAQARPTAADHQVRSTAKSDQRSIERDTICQCTTARNRHLRCRKDAGACQSAAGQIEQTGIDGVGAVVGQRAVVEAEGSPHRVDKTTAVVG